MPVNDRTRQTARRLLTTRMALALGFGVLLTLLVLSGLNAVHVISHLQSNNEEILGQFLGRATRLDELRAAIYLSGTTFGTICSSRTRLRGTKRLALADTRRQIQSMISLTTSEPDAADQEMYDALRREIRGVLADTRSCPHLNARQRSQKVIGSFTTMCYHDGPVRSASQTLLPR